MRVSSVLAFLLVLPLTACSDDADGAFSLVSVGDDDLPAVDQGVAITSGEVEIREDSLVWQETVVFGYGTQSAQEVEVRVATAYEVDGQVVSALPEAFVIPDDTFMQCVTAGVYRIEDGGRTLRMIDLVSDGECLPIDPEIPMRVYRRR